MADQVLHTLNTANASQSTPLLNWAAIVAL